jgi:hypothetical protein
MSNGALQSIVQRLSNEMSVQGFEHVGPYLLRRARNKLDQFIELQPGDRWLDGKFTCNIAWRFIFAGLPASNALHYRQRLSETWLPYKPDEEIENSYALLRRWIDAYSLPFLDSLDSVETLIKKYEEAVATNSDDIVPAADNPLLFFGRGGWKHCLLGFAYKEFGNVEKAKYHLNLVVEQHSSEPYDWVQQRKAASQAALSELRFTSRQ